MADNAYFNSNDVDYSDFYSGSMAPPVSNNRGGLIPRNNAGGLTTRTVTTVPIDPRTGLPKIPTLQTAGGSSKPTAAQLAAIRDVSGAPTRFSPTLQASAQSPRLLPTSPLANGYAATNPFVRPLANRALDAANAVAAGGLTPPRWGAPAPNWGGGNPRFPVTNSPQIEQAYADMVAGKPGARDTYTRLLADAAQRGEVNGATGGSSRSLVPSTIRGSSTGQQYTVGQRYTGTNGYEYTAGPGGFYKTGNPVGGGAAAYAARTGGPGSVAEMERRHSGGGGSQSGGPAGGGEYASGGR